MALLFVYGTLKAGGCRHHYLEGAVFLGTAATEPGYTLYDCGAYPAMVAADGGWVVGELYSVSPELLDEVIDEVEGRPDWYDRVEIDLRDAEDRPIRAFTYVYQQPVDNLQPLGSEWRS